MGTSKSKTQWVMHAFCVIAFLCLGFAHKTPPLYAASIEAASLQLPDGSYADLCVAEKGTKHPAATPFCEVCIVCASMLLPAPDGREWLLVHFASLFNPWVFQTAGLAAHLTPLARSRGPPVLS